MKDMGGRFGSGAWAVPVIVSGDTVYVHTDIEQVTEMNGEPASDLYKYHEVQYGVQEYIEQVGQENANLTAQVEDTQTQLTETQLALCEVYELIDGMGV
jgi:hypothetical protein